MRKFLLVLVYVLASSASYADALTDKISELSEGLAGLIPGEGHTETSIDLRNNGGGMMDQAISIVDIFISTNDTILKSV